VRIVLDTTILVRATENSHGIARDLLLNIVTSEHGLVLSNEILYELARVLRYPRLQALYRLSETRVYEFVGFLREVAEIVRLSPVFNLPIRDVNDLIVVQTAVIGEANVLCAKDRDFYDPATAEFLSGVGISVMDDVSLLQRLRSGK
jgi:putative PIN family toxin of toxin-antitoxin system